MPLALRVPGTAAGARDRGCPCSTPTWRRPSSRWPACRGRRSCAGRDLAGAWPAGAAGGHGPRAHPGQPRDLRGGGQGGRALGRAEAHRERGAGASPPADRFELYDLARDPAEASDLSERGRRWSSTSGWSRGRGGRAEEAFRLRVGAGRTVELSAGGPGGPARAGVRRVTGLRSALYDVCVARDPRRAARATPGDGALAAARPSGPARPRPVPLLRDRARHPARRSCPAWPSSTGSYAEGQVREALTGLTADPRVGEFLGHLRETLSGAGFLEDEAFERMRAERHREFAGARAARGRARGLGLPGVGRPVAGGHGGVHGRGLGRAGGAAAARRRPDRDRRSPRQPRGRLAVVSRRLSPPWLPRTPRRTFVILGTSHYGEPERFGLTRKPFLTPCGETRDRHGPGGRAGGRRRGRRSCSRTTATPSSTPSSSRSCSCSTCSGPASGSCPSCAGPSRAARGGRAGRRTTRACGASWARWARWRPREGGRLLLRPGRGHGARGPPLRRRAQRPRGRRGMARVEARDRGRIDRIAAGTPAGFWDLVQETRDDLRWCGASPLYTFLHAVPGPGRAAALRAVEHRRAQRGQLRGPGLPRARRRVLRYPGRSGPCRPEEERDPTHADRDRRSGRWPSPCRSSPCAPAPASSAEKPAVKRAPKAPAADAVAIMAGEPITSAEFEELAGPRLFAVRTQEYNQKRALLEEAIDARLLEKEGKARGISADELIRVEVDAKVPAVTEAEQKEYYEKNKPRFGTTPEAEALKQIEAGLRQQRARERRMAFVKELRDKVGVQHPARSAARGGERGRDDPAKGPATAPITIVEFSDFQCPYCARVNPTLKQVEEKYGDKLRVVFRDFPLAPDPQGRGQGRGGGGVRARAGQVLGDARQALRQPGQAPGRGPEAGGHRDRPRRRDLQPVPGLRQARRGVAEGHGRGRALRGDGHARLLHQRPPARAARSPSRPSRRSSTRSWPGCSRRRRRRRGARSSPAAVRARGPRARGAGRVGRVHEARDARAARPGLRPPSRRGSRRGRRRASATPPGTCSCSSRRAGASWRWTAPTTAGDPRGTRGCCPRRRASAPSRSTTQGPGTSPTTAARCGASSPSRRP